MAHLGESDATRLRAIVGRLERDGPSLGRPRVDTVSGSRYSNMKELRGNGGVRVLFAFNPNREAFLILGGDKTGDWKGWYTRNIPRADAVYTKHLQELGRGVGWSQGARTARGRGTESGR